MEKIKSIICLILGHKYKVTQRITKSISELQCKRCKMEFGMNTDTQSLLPLDNELRKLHKELI